MKEKRNMTDFIGTHGTTCMSVFPGLTEQEFRSEVSNLEVWRMMNALSGQCQEGKGLKGVEERILFRHTDVQYSDKRCSGMEDKEFSLNR